MNFKIKRLKLLNALAKATKAELSLIYKTIV